MPPDHRRRIKTEEKVKDVAAVWGAEFIQYLAALAILHKDEFEEKDEFILFLQIIPVATHPIHQLVLLQNS